MKTEKDNRTVMGWINRSIQKVRDSNATFNLMLIIPAVAFAVVGVGYMDGSNPVLGLMMVVVTAAVIISICIATGIVIEDFLEGSYEDAIGEVAALCPGTRSRGRKNAKRAAEAEQARRREQEKEQALERIREESRKTLPKQRKKTHNTPKHR